MKFLGYLRIQFLQQIMLSPTDQSDDMDFVEKNASVFTKFIQYLDNKRQWKTNKRHGRQISFVTFVGRKTTKHLNVKSDGKEIFVRI